MYEKALAQLIHDLADVIHRFGDAIADEHGSEASPEASGVRSVPGYVTQQRGFLEPMFAAGSEGLSRDEAREVALKAGYDNRGVWQLWGRPDGLAVVDGDRVKITAKGVERLHHLRRRMGE